jgi:tRNA(Ile)-lysidine synthase
VEPLEGRVARFILDNNLLAGSGRVLLAISGGADSIALLHIMDRLASDGAIHAGLVCAHLNHGLRGTDGDGDEAFVVQQAHELGLPVVSKTVDVKAHAQAHRLSIETAARQLRLRFLTEIARTHGCSWIAMGHQQNDNAETVLQRIGRGTGYRGLGGIRPSRQADQNLVFVRPLLCCSRAEIVEYLRSRSLAWREDHTNADCAYTRNRIRHQLLPALQSTCNGSLVEELASLSASAARLHERIAAAATAAIEKHARYDADKATIDAATLAGLPEPVAIEAVRQLLAHVGLGERDLTRRHYGGLLALARHCRPKQKLSLPDDFRAQYEYGAVVLRRPTSPDRDSPGPAELGIPGMTSFGPYRIDAQVLDATRIDRTAIANKTDPYLEYLNLDRIKPPLIARLRRPGDRFVPLGQRSEKKLGKFLTAAKVRDDLRSRVFVIEDAENILWVAPVRINERAKVTERTTTILVLQITEGVAESVSDDYK